MNDEQVSRTAQMTAYNRGFHCRNDAPVIFDDFLAFDVLGHDARRSIEEKMMAMLRAVNPEAAAAFNDEESALGWLMQAGAAAPIVLGRARYAEELLKRALEKGGRQYVLLGAGLDTFAFRYPELLADIHVFELDHPGTQEYKRRRLDELGWELPGNLHFIPVDFTRTGLADALQESGFDTQVPAFFSWLGVTYYLTRSEVMATLQDIARISAPGSAIVFDYLDMDAYVARLAAPRVQRMIEGVRGLGEPMLSGFDPLLAGRRTGAGRTDADGGVEPGRHPHALFHGAHRSLPGLRTCPFCICNRRMMSGSNDGAGEECGCFGWWSCRGA